MDGVSTPVRLTTKPTDVPIACTLDAGDVPDRLTEWRALLDKALTRTRVGDGVAHIDFGRAADVGEIARLVAAEQACCAFFSFAIRVDASGTRLEVTAPPEAAVIVDELFGAPAP